MENKKIKKVFNLVEGADFHFSTSGSHAGSIQVVINSGIHLFHLLFSAVLILQKYLTLLALWLYISLPNHLKESKQIHVKEMKQMRRTPGLGEKGSAKSNLRPPSP